MSYFANFYTKAPAISLVGAFPLFVNQHIEPVAVSFVFVYETVYMSGNGSIFRQTKDVMEIW